jgi:hypothetical protein
MLKNLRVGLIVRRKNLRVKAPPPETGFSPISQTKIGMTGGGIFVIELPLLMD